MITINAKHSYFRCEQLFFLREIDRFLKTLLSFCIYEKALFLDPRDSRLDTQFWIVSSIEARGLSLEGQVSSMNLLLGSTVCEKHSKLPFRPESTFKVSWWLFCCSSSCFFVCATCGLCIFTVKLPGNHADWSSRILWVVHGLLVPAR